MNCPSCGGTVSADHECVYRHPRKPVIIRLTRSMPPSVGDGIVNYQLRIADSLPGYLETIRIFDAGLNDAIVGICKLHILGSSRRISDTDHLRFQTIDDAELLRFTVVGPTNPGHYVTLPRHEYDAECKRLPDLLAQTSVKGAWLKIDDTFLRPFLTSPPRA